MASHAQGVRSSLATAVEEFGPYELYMLAVSSFSLVVLAADTLLTLSPAVHDVLAFTDAVLCLLFGIDFVRNAVRAPNRMRYLVRGGWLDLASSVPTIGVLRLGRIGRIARIVRVLRAMRSVRTIGTTISSRRQQSALLAAGVVSLLMVFFASLAVLQFERVPDANITSGGDALWWAFATITTVGYGDRYPVTLEGRVVAATLMAAGVGLFGILSGLVASWFLHGGSNGDDRGDQILQEVEALRAQVAAIRERMTT